MKKLLRISGIALVLTLGASTLAMAQVDFSHHDSNNSKEENLETLHNMQGAAAINPYLVNRKNTLEADGIDISTPSNPFTQQGNNSSGYSNSNSNENGSGNSSSWAGSDRSNASSTGKTSNQIQNFFK